MAALIGLTVSVFFYSVSSASSERRSPATGPVSMARAGVKAESAKKEKARAGVDQSLAEQARQAQVSAGVSRIFATLLPMQSQAESIATYATDCSTPKNSFALGESVCAKIVGAPVGIRTLRRLAWVSRINSTVRRVDVVSSSQSDTYLLPADAISVLDAIANVSVDNRGEWRIVSLDAADGTVRASAFFTVRDPVTPYSDLVVNQSASSADDGVASGGFATFEVQVENRGPETAQGVTVTNVTPANMTFQSASGSGFNCANTTATASTTTCTATSALAKGDVASFTFIYQVNAGTAAGTLITNTVSAASSTAELEPTDNSSQAGITVASAGGGGDTCALDCPNNIVVAADTTQNGQSGAFVNFAPPEDIGSCGTVTTSIPSGSFFAVGAPTTVTATSSEGGGSCSFTVTVLGSAAPTVSCPADQTVTAAAGETEVTLDPGTASGSGNNITVAGSRSDGHSLTAPYPIGGTAITWTATDADGRTASCTQLITVNKPAGPPPPTISCPADQTVTASQDECAVTLDPGTPTTTGENVEVIGRRSDNKALNTPYHAGTTTITWTASNENGESSCTQTIVVNATDTTPPVITAPPDVTACAKGTTAILDDEFGQPTATDNCSTTVSIARSGVPANFVFPLGQTIITYTATDAAGNKATATQKVIVITDTPPTITAPAAVTLHTGPGATECGVKIDPANLDATLGSATASDSCSDVSVERSGVPANNSFPVGTTTLTYKATDASGQTASATQTVTVVDDTPPTLTINGNAAMTVECHSTFTDPGASATDNCAVIGPVSTSGSVNTDVPGTYTLTYSASDGANTATATRAVTVVDTVAPTIALNGSSSVTVECHTSFNDPGANASDTCAGALTSAITVSGTVNLDAPGTYTRTYSVSDGTNSSSVSRTIIVVDTTPPTIACAANISTVGNITGSCGANVSIVAPTASDSCASNVNVVGTRSDNLALNAAYPQGTTTINWTATDASGNSSSCAQTVTVTNPSPVVTIAGPASGSVYAVGTPITFTGGYADNPGGTHTATWAFDGAPQSGTVNESTSAASLTRSFTTPGVYFVTLTVNDGCGGSGTANQVGGLDAMVVIYDPSGGFVTGGGWINSPAGAYAANPSLTDKANFGFVSKYQQGAAPPNGQTEFQFKAGGLNFSSNAYEWLVIAGARAQYKGTGTINGAGNYGFILTAIDGQINGGGGTDKFRVKIWDKNNGDAVVYDNQMGAGVDDNPTTTLGGGSIVIHH
ncbi:MAG TPA: immunoglobulin-like domain-containing protein [Pyrinomonadaceae bacterium]